METSAEPVMSVRKKPVKARRRFHDLELTVVGLKHYVTPHQFLQLEERIEDSGGVPCRFEREPDNEVDPKAVKVVVLDPERKVLNNFHIGYVRRPGNGALNDLLRKGASVKLCLLVYLDSDAGEGELQVRILPPSP